LTPYSPAIWDDAENDLTGDDMQHIFDALLARPFLTVGLGAFMSGVALFYLVMQRTRKHRIRDAEQRGL